MSESWPRVTRVLEAVGLRPNLAMVAPDVLEAARHRGTAVHEASEALAYGYLDESLIPPDAAPYVSALRKFYAESRFEAIAAEVTVAHPAWRFRGHVDLVGWLNGIRILLDVKTGDATAADVQVAAYFDGWNATRWLEPLQAAAILHLREDGTYRWEEVAIAAALPVWHAALIVYRAQPRRAAC